MEFAPGQTVASEQGRGDDATDPDGSFLAEFFVPLKPQGEWPKGLSKIQLVDEMNAKLNSQFIGIDFNFSQYIQDNIEEAVSGVKGENSIKLFGRDLGELERISKSLKTELVKVPGIVNPAAFNLLGQPNLNVRIDRGKAARYGFSVGDINTMVQAAIGGQEVTRVYEGEINSALTVRLAARYRDNIDAIRMIPIALPGSDAKATPAYIALSDVADVRWRPAPLYLSGKQPALHSAEIQRARTRPRLDRGRGAGTYRQERAAAAGLSHGVVGRVRRAAGRQEAACRHRAAQPRPDPGAALRPVQFGARQLHRAVRDSVRGRRRHPRALCGGPQCQRLGSRGLHLAVRRRRDGWHSAGVLHPPGRGGQGNRRPCRHSASEARMPGL
jgi:hypothetical protein